MKQDDKKNNFIHVFYCFLLLIPRFPLSYTINRRNSSKG